MSRDVDDVFRRGLAELEPLPPLDLRERTVAHVGRRKRKRAVLTSSLTAAACVVVAAAAVLARDAHQVVVQQDPRVAQTPEGGNGKGDTPAKPSENPKTLAHNGAQTPDLDGTPSGRSPSATDGVPSELAPANGDSNVIDVDTGNTASGPIAGPAPVDRGNGSAVVGPPAPITPVALAADVVVTRDNSGLHTSTLAVIAPEFNVTFDDRSGAAALTVAGTSVADGATVPVTRGVGSLAFTAAGESLSIDVVAPTLAAADEDAHTITIDMREGEIGLPYRTRADDAPWVEGVGERSGHRWTAIVPGTYTLRFVNTMHKSRTYVVTGYGRVFVGNGDDEVSVTVTFGQRADRTYVITSEFNKKARAGEVLNLWLR